jgi:hypothetical protein
VDGDPARDRKDQQQDCQCKKHSHLLSASGSEGRAGRQLENVLPLDH